MSRSKNRLLLSLLLVAFGGAGASLFWLGAADRGTEPIVDAEGAVGGGSAASAAEDENGRRTGAAPAAAGVTGPDMARRVVYPLQVELELVQPADLPVVDGVPAAGTGATAGIVGTIQGIDGGPCVGNAVFVEGANRGRVLACDETGAFGASDLYPGLSIVELEGPGIPGAVREVQLRQNRKAELNVGFSRPATVYGAVQDTEGQPIVGAQVTLDGQNAISDAQGEFYFPRVAPGPALAVVEKPGYARYREELNLQGGAVIPRGKIRFFLERGAALQVRIQPAIGAGREAQLFLSPTNWMSARPGRSGQRTYPWYKVSPVPVFPGGSALIEDLPAGRITVRLFHPGASPEVRSVVLRAGERAELVIDMDPVPVLSGVVMRGDEAVEGASVSLEAPDRVIATLKALGEPYSFLETGVMPHFPPAVQATRTDREGRFELAPSEDVSGVRYLRVLGPDGTEEATRIVKPGEREVRVRLSPRGEPDGVLELDLGPRRLPLPVRYRVRGKPFYMELAPGEPLRIGQLTRGVWKITARWDTELLTEDQWIVVAPRGKVALELPAGAREGQVLEEQVRAGAR